MSICAIIGDSIALGLALANPQCDRNAVVGRNAAVIAKQEMERHYNWAVISAGTNNPTNQLRSQLYKIRKNLNATKVVWVVPTNARAAYAVRVVAVVFGDKTVTFKPAKDGIHPKSYRALSRDVKKAL